MEKSIRDEEESIKLSSVREMPKATIDQRKQNVYYSHMVHLKYCNIHYKTSAIKAAKTTISL